MSSFPEFSHRTDFNEVVARTTKMLTEQEPALPWVRHLMGGKEPLIEDQVRRIIHEGIVEITDGQAEGYASGGVRVYHNEEAGTVEVSVLAGRWSLIEGKWTA